MSTTPATATTTPPADTGVLRLNPMFRLQWEEVQQAYVILYPEGMVKLNQSAAEILKRCDGTRTLDQMIIELQTTFGAPDLRAEVSSFVEHARSRNWLLK